MISPDIGGGFGNKVPDLPRLRVRDRRLDRHRQAGEVDGGPLREPDVDRLRPRLPHARRDRGDEGRQDPRRPRGRASPTTARSTPPRSRRSTRPGSSTSSPAPTTSRPRTARSRASTRTRRPAASRTPARSASPRPSTSSSAWSTCSPHELGDRPGGAAAEEPHPPRAVPVREQDRLGRTTPATTRRALRKAMDIAGYDELRREQAEKRERGELMGIGVVVLHRDGRRRAAQAHGHRRPGHGRRRRAARPPDRQGDARHQRADAGPGPRDDVRPDRRRGARHPARGHRGRPRRHRPHAVRPRHLRLALDAGVAARRPRSSRARCATRRGSSPRRCSRSPPDDLEWEKGRWFVKGDPEKGATIQEIAIGAHGSVELPEGVEGDLDAETVYNPPNLTFPFGAYICVVDVDPGTGKVKVRRFIAVDDCGTRINPMIIEGQVHGGLADGVGIALMELIAFDEEGNCLGGSFMDYLHPDRDGGARLGDRLHGHARRRTTRSAPRASGESATVGSPPAIVNAVVDALEPYGVRHMDMPCTPARVWEAMQGRRRRRMIAGALARTRGARCARRASRSWRRRSCARSAPPACTPGDAAIVLADGTIDGLRRRRLRADVGAPARAAGARDGRAAAAADRPRRRGERGARRRARSSRTTRACGRRARDLPRAPAAGAARWSSSATRPIARALAELGRAAGYEVVRRRARRTRATRRSSSPRTATGEEHALAAALGAGVPYVGARREPRRAARSVRASLDAAGGPARAAPRRRPGSTSAPGRRSRSRSRSWPSSSRARAADARGGATRSTRLRHAGRSTRSRTLLVGERWVLLRGLPRGSSRGRRQRPVLAAGGLGGSAAEAAAALRRRRRCSTTCSARRAPAGSTS